MKNNIFLSIALALAQVVPAQDTLRVMHYNLLYYGNIGGCSASQNDVSQKNAFLRTITRYVQPDILTVNELGRTAPLADSILNDVLNTGNVTHYQRAALTNLNPPSSIVNMLYYNADKLTLLSQEQVEKNLSNQNLTRLVDIYNLCYIDLNQDTAFLTVIAFHLHSSDQQKRADATEALMAALTQKGPGNYIACGDYNVDSYQETAFDNMLNPADPAMRFNDPLNKLGSWHNNSFYADVHTQSTRTTNTNNGCFNSGGLDDRFDMILASNYVLTGVRAICYINGSYKALGQDGSAFNQPLPTAGNLAAPDSVALALYGMSDHLPVVMDLRANPASNARSEEKEQSPFRILNPATDRLRIYTPEALNGRYTAELRDAWGRAVFSFNLNASAGVTSTDLPGLKNGFYLLDIRGPDGRHYKRKLLRMSLDP